MMKSKNNNELVTFLKDNIEPYEDEFDGIMYRTAVYLIDGTYLPCVIFKNAELKVKKLQQHFRNRRPTWSFAKDSRISDLEVSMEFLLGNRISDHNIVKIEKSKYAFPNSILKQIKAPVLSGAGFAAKMNDGKYVGFHSNIGTDYFFSMPIEYTVNNIVEIILDGYVLENGQMQITKYEGTSTKYINEAVFYEPQLHFDCYIEGL